MNLYFFQHVAMGIGKTIVILSIHQYVTTGQAMKNVAGVANIKRTQKNLVSFPVHSFNALIITSPKGLFTQLF